VIDLGTIPTDFDTDGDRIPDGYELTLGTSPTTPGCQPSLKGEGEDYFVQADDWLSKLADKEYGDPFAYPAIIYYTNLKNAEEEGSYTKIICEGFLQPEDQIYIPSREEFEAYFGCQ
jgi:hypothetical protein